MVNITKVGKPASYKHETCMHILGQLNLAVNLRSAHHVDIASSKFSATMYTEEVES